MVFESVGAFPLIGMQRMYCRDGWKYIFNCGGADELYCQREDPYEMRNRVNDPGCRDRLLSMREGLAAAMYHHGDDSAPWFCKVNHIGDWALD